MNCPKSNCSPLSKGLIKVKSGKIKDRQRTKISPDISGLHSVEKAQFLARIPLGMQPTQWIWHPVKEWLLSNETLHIFT
jgi:hypothetical protein